MLRTILLALLFMAITPVHAAETTPEGAKHLKSVFQTIIANTNTITQDPKPVFEGEIRVEPVDGYYAVTLPFYKVEWNDGRRMDFGMVSINAVPDDTNPKQWKMAIAVPTPFTLYDRDETPLVQFSIGAQRAAAIFDEDLQNFVKLDALYTNLKIQAMNGENVTTTIPEFIVRFDMPKDDQNRVTGDGLFLMKNVTLNSPDDNFKTTLGSLQIDFEVDQYNIQGFQTAQNRLNTLTTGISTENLDTKARDKELNKTLNTLYTSLGEKMKITYALSDLNIEKNTPDKATENLSLQNASAGINLGGFVSGNAYAGTTLSMNGLSLDTDEKAKDILPENINLDLSVQNIPYKQLSSIVQNSLTSGSKNGISMINLMIKLPALLSQAETAITLKNSFIGNNDYKMSLDGNIIADLTATNNATAQINGQFDGLDWLITKMQNLQSTDSKNANQYFDSLKQLQLMKAFGQKSQTNDSYTYEFIMNPQGQITLNGNDISGLTSVIQPPKQ